MRLTGGGKWPCNGVGGGTPIMMGLKERAFAPKVSVSLEELVPQDHFYRHLQKVLDLSLVHELVRGCYAAGGRPSIDPVVFFKLQLVMFFEDIRSERLLMRQVADRLSVRWYLGYDLDEQLPDHSSLSKIRLRYGLEVFRRFFEAIVEQCQQAKLVWGKELYFDSTQVHANADLDSLTPRFAVEAREAIREHLTALFAPEPAPLEKPLASSSDTPLPEYQPEDGFCAGPTPLPVVLSEAQHEELATENAARHDWFAEEGRQQREVRGSFERTADFRISTTDPDATPMRLKGGGTHLGYHTHYVVDGGKRRIILAVLVTPGEVMDNHPMQDLLWHTCFRWHLWPTQVTADSLYGTGENLKAIEAAHIRAYIPITERGQSNMNMGYYGLAQFTGFRQSGSVSLSPGACLALSVPPGRDTGDPIPCGCGDLQCLPGQSAVYRKPAWSARPPLLFCRLCGTGQGLPANRRLPEGSEQAQGVGRTAVWRRQAVAWDGTVSRDARLWRVNGEALVIASGQNLKRLLQKRGWGRRPFPTEAVALRLPGSEEADALPRNIPLKNDRASVAAAFLVSYEVARTLFEANSSRFSLVNITFVISLWFLAITSFLTHIPYSGESVAKSSSCIPR